MWHGRTRSCGRWAVCGRRGWTDSRNLEPAPPLSFFWVVRISLGREAGLVPGVYNTALWSLVGAGAPTCRGGWLVSYAARFDGRSTAPPYTRPRTNPRPSALQGSPGTLSGCQCPAHLVEKAGRRPSFWVECGYAHQKREETRREPVIAPPSACGGSRGAFVKRR